MIHGRISNGTHSDRITRPQLELVRKQLLVEHIRVIQRIVVLKNCDIEPIGHIRDVEDIRVEHKNVVQGLVGQVKVCN